MGIIVRIPIMGLSIFRPNNDGYIMRKDLKRCPFCGYSMSEPKHVCVDSYQNMRKYYIDKMTKPGQNDKNCQVDKNEKSS